MNYYLLDYRGALIGKSGESIGSEYTLTNACSECGTGAKYIGNFKFKSDSKNKNFYVTLDGDYIISDEIYNALLQADCKIEFAETETKRGEKLPYWHMTSEVEFPSVDFSPSLRVEPLWQCPVCKKNGWIGSNLRENGKTHILPFLFSYKEVSQQLLNKSDVFVTWECFGKSSIKVEGIFGIGFARPILIVSEKVKNVLTSYSKFFEFEKIDILSIRK